MKENPRSSRGPGAGDGSWLLRFWLTLLPFCVCWAPRLPLYSVSWKHMTVSVGNRLRILPGVLLRPYGHLAWTVRLLVRSCSNPATPNSHEICVQRCRSLQLLHIFKLLVRYHSLLHHEHDPLASECIRHRLVICLMPRTGSVMRVGDSRVCSEKLVYGKMSPTSPTAVLDYYGEESTCGEELGDDIQPITGPESRLRSALVPDRAKDAAARANGEQTCESIPVQRCLTRNSCIVSRVNTQITTIRPQSYCRLQLRWVQAPD